MTFASAHTARRIAKWEVLEEETGSDHNYLYYTVDSTTGNNESVPLGWCRKKLDMQKLKEYLSNKETPRDAYELMEIMKEACDAPQCLELKIHVNTTNHNTGGQTG